jgi:calcineurin-like phosphoesterase family protein
MNNIFFTSDTHFYHGNCIKYCNRPFKDVDEMNETLIDNWNKTINKRDIVYFLGDFSFSNKENTIKIIERLNGQVNFIRGNHDKVLKNIKSINILHDILNLKKLKIVLCHYPLLTWEGSGRDWIHLHGHCHGNLQPKFNINSKRYDVGVDCNNYLPISYDDIKIKMDKIEYIPVDHHKPEYYK